MLVQRNNGRHAAIDPPCARSALASKTIARLALPLVAVWVAASLTSGCGSASTPLEKYQNCLKCGYDFVQPIPTAGLEDVRRPKPGLVAFGRDD